MVVLFIGAKSATGLMEWIEMEVALEAFIIANHQTVYSQGTYIIIIYRGLKLNRKDLGYLYQFSPVITTYNY